MVMSLWARYRHAGAIRFGSLEGSTLHEYAGELFGTATPTGASVALDEVELLTPCVPSKMVALAHNFHASLAKADASAPEHPLYFLKPNNSFHPTGKPIRKPAAYHGKVIFEGELGLVIGRECHDVAADAALDYLFGCTCVNDVTSIGLLKADPAFVQWTRCKAADTYGVFGPVIATDLDPAGLSVRTVLDGQERQNYPISDMVFTPADLISRISRDLTLLPGDVISCGTSVGVGSMKPGAVIEISIAGIGTLRNSYLG